MNTVRSSVFSASSDGRCAGTSSAWPAGTRDLGPMPLTARSVSTSIPNLAATCGSVSFGFIRYACHETSGCAVSSSLAAKISALSIGRRIECSSAPAITGRLCCGLRARKSSTDSSANSAARLVSILRLVFTTAKNGASGMSASTRPYFSGSRTMFFTACSLGR